MNKLAAVFAIAFASNIVLAGDVGAPYPQVLSVAPTNVAIAVAETGASTSWAIQPNEALVTENQSRESDERIERFNTQMIEEIQAYSSDRLSDRIKDVTK